MSSTEQQLIENLTSPQRSTVEAILARSECHTIPAKALETALALVHVHADDATAHLLSVLARTVVFVLLKDPQDWDTLLILENAEGTSYLAAFSSEAQVETARREYGASYQSTAIDVVLLCRSVGGKLGLAINPHDEVLSFVIAPEIFAPFRSSLRERSKPVPGNYYSVFAGSSGYHAARIDSATASLLKLTWLEAGWPMRPANIDLETCTNYAPKSCETSPKAFQRWLPLAAI